MTLFDFGTHSFSLTNLLTNSGFDAWSNSGLTSGVASGRQIDFNVDELMTLDVAPVPSSFAVGATITGASSGITCVVTQVFSSTSYMVNARDGNFILGEILGDGANTADQGAANPTFSNPLFDNDGSTFAAWSVIEGGMTDTGANLLITENGGVGVQTSRYVLAVEVGKLYKASIVTADGTGAWGATDILAAQANGGGAVIESITDLSAGTYSIIFEATAVNNEIEILTNLGVGETLNITSVYVDEVTLGCVAADTLGPDRWYKKSGLKVLRQHLDTVFTKDGSFYSLKFDSITANDNLIWPLAAIKTLPEHYSKFAGRTVAFGCWVYATTASHVFLQIVDSDTTDDLQTSDASAYHTGDSAWEWLEFSMAVSSATTEFSIAICFDSTTPAFISQPMLVFGSFIGEGNYSPSIETDIVSDTSPQLGGTLDTNAQAINNSYATVASHATTSAIWAAAGNIINFTGTETITDFPAADQAGSQRFLICAAACVFTHAGNITVQGGATYTAAAGDVVIITATTTTAFKVNILQQSNYLTVLGLNDGTYDIALPTNNPGAAKFMLGNSSTILWMYLNAAPPGWKALATGADTVLGVSGGADAYNTTGGTAAGTWTQPNHTHTYNTVIAHTHNVLVYSGAGGPVGTVSGFNTGTPTYSAPAAAQSTGSASGTTAGGATAATYRPSASVGKLFQLDTA